MPHGGAGSGDTGRVFEKSATESTDARPVRVASDSVWSSSTSLTTRLTHTDTHTPIRGLGCGLENSLSAVVLVIEREQN